MRVILDIFSGRPNPSWDLPEKAARDLIERFTGKALPSVASVLPALGFRGFIISTDQDDEARRAKLPDVFHIGGVSPREFVSIARTTLPALQDDESDEAALWLLDTAKAAVGDDLASYVVSAIETHRVAEPEKPTPRARRRRPEPSVAAGCVIRNSPYVPAFWNQPGVVPFNNCYNYAMNYRSNTFAQPGRISGEVLSALTCDNVIAAAARDRCTLTCNGTVKQVALVMWPGFDFHWYRRHTDNFWGHKVGPNEATNLDNVGRIIGGNLDPQNCARGPYTDFCGFLFPPLGIIVL